MRHLTTHWLSAVGRRGKHASLANKRMAGSMGMLQAGSQGVARIRQCLSKSPPRIRSTARYIGSIGSSFSPWLVLLGSSHHDGAVSWPAALQSPTGDEASDVTQWESGCGNATVLRSRWSNLELSTLAGPEPQWRMHRLCHSGLFAGAHNLARMTMKAQKRTKHHHTNCPTIPPPRATKRKPRRNFPHSLRRGEGWSCSAVRCLSARRPSSRHR